MNLLTATFGFSVIMDRKATNAGRKVSKISSLFENLTLLAFERTDLKQTIPLFSHTRSGFPLILPALGKYKKKNEQPHAGRTSIREVI